MDGHVCRYRGATFHANVEYFMEEVQHDTSPREVEIARKKCKVQTASAVLCYSCMLFLQCYRPFSAPIANSFSPKLCAILVKEPRGISLHAGPR